MEQVHMFITMELFIKDNGKMINKKGLVRKYLQIIQLMKVNL